MLSFPLPSPGGARLAANTENRVDPERARWVRGFEPLESELSCCGLTSITGPALPEGLRGTLYRNGNGRNERFGERNGHWFDGDGMVVAFRFDGGRVTFSNRYVQTDDYVAERRARRPLLPRGGTLSRRRVRDMIPRLHNSANVNVVYHQDRLIALSDLGRPITLHARTLEALGEESFGGTLPRRILGSFPAHPHLDPVAACLVNVGPVFTPTMMTRPSWQVVEVPSSGPLRRTVSFTSHRPFWVHDFGLTQSKIVVLGAPRYLEAHRIARVLAGREPFLHGLGYHPDEPMFAYVVDRRGRTATRIYELDPGLVLHFANAYDLGGDVVVDAVHYQDDGAMALVDAFYRGQCGVAAPGLLTRLVLRADGSVSREVLSEHGAEMPTIAQAHSSLPYRYTYALKATHELPVGSRILKIDASTKRTQVVDFGPGQFVCEPVFAPAPGHRYEDDGWVLTLVYDGTSHRSYLAVVRADDFTGPLTKVHLPFHVPHGFHGCFVPGF